jgi:hypothetical protein
MTAFATDREAKEYLVARIVDEATREGSPLTEIERKMLHFTESGWTLPDIMEVNAEFERDYDNDEYEAKIHALVNAIEAGDKTGNPGDVETWRSAVAKLREGDHYLLVLIDGLSLPGQSKPRPPGDFVRLILTAIGLSALLFVLMLFFRKR